MQVWFNRERRSVSKIANCLSAMKEPSFKVTQRSVRDGYTHMERNHKTKVAQEERASGVTLEETEVDRAMEKIIQLFKEYDQENEKLSDEKKKIAEEDVAKAEEMRRESRETSKETKKRNESESEQSEILHKKRRASGSDTMNYLKEMGETKGKRQVEEMAMRRQEMEKQSELQREEMKLRNQEVEDQRNQDEAMQQSMMT